MSGPNFSLQDITGGVLAAVVLTPVFVSPGYALGWVLDVQDFRRRAFAARLALAVMLSVAVGPAAAYLVARVTSLGVVVGVYALVTIALTAVVVLRGVRRAAGGLVAVVSDSDHSMLRWGICASFVWAAYALSQICDIQFADKLYTSPAAFDYAKHISVTDAIARTGVPPVNPSFLPGHPVALYYYYFWFLLCSLAVTVTGGAVEARAAVLGGTVWAGVALMAAVGLYARDFASRSDAMARRAVRVAIALLLVSGLDVIPVVARSLRETVRGGHLSVIPSVEWWNEQVTAWVNALIWVPHHTTALVATLAALLLLREAAARTRPAERWALASVCGLALSSALGLSIWVTFSFTVFWAAWIAVAYLRGWRTEAWTAVGAGMVGAVLSLPFLRDLAHANLVPPQRPVGVAVRAFRPLDARLNAHHIDGARQQLARLIALPLNYLVEFGFFSLAAAVYWLWRRRRADPLTRDELALATLAGASVLVGTFVEARLRYNDLAARGLMAAQFVLLLWATDVCLALLRRARRDVAGDAPSAAPVGAAATALLLGSLVVGVATSAYDPIVLRFYPMLQERGVTTWSDVPSAVRLDGAHLYALRRALWNIGERLPSTAVLQPNPHVPGGIDVYTHLYAERQVFAADPEYGALYGVPRPMYDSVSAPITAVFGDSLGPGHPTRTDSATAASLCRRLRISAWVVTDMDPVWKQRDSWVWDTQPLVANGHVRVVGCPANP